MNYLLDTCVLAESRRKPVDKNLKTWLTSVSSEALFISVLTLGEIRYGIEKLQVEKRRMQLTSWLENELTAWFGNRVLAFDAETVDQWGYLRAYHRTLPTIDSLLAATAITRHLTLVTRNVKDFAGIDELKVLNPLEIAE
ncbi:MAG: type II toxin-antitoxin system VapC family toxin [Synergistaceae bacterium]|nr:type II toxin-antitoxin system VapC family toxin [Synergistaceae bacterium]